MAEAVTVTWPQDKQLVETAYQAKEIVYINLSGTITSDISPRIDTLYSKPWSTAYLVIENSLASNINEYKYGLNYLHLLTPNTNSFTPTLFISSSDGYVPSLMADANTGMAATFECDATSIKLKYTNSTLYTLHIACRGYLLIMS